MYDRFQMHQPDVLDAHLFHLDNSDQNTWVILQNVTEICNN